MKFQYRRIKHLAQVDGPQLVRSRPTDAGADIRANHDCVVVAKESAVISTGISINVPTGYMVMVRPRSGLGFKHDIICFGGVVDSFYTGELRVKLFNHSKTNFKVSAGDRIAQLVVVPIEVGEFIEVEELDTEKEIREKNDDTMRGDAGFGSSGLGV